MYQMTQWPCLEVFLKEAFVRPWGRAQALERGRQESGQRVLSRAARWRGRPPSLHGKGQCPLDLPAPRRALWEMPEQEEGQRRGSTTRGPMLEEQIAERVNEECHGLPQKGSVNHAACSCPGAGEHASVPWKPLFPSGRLGNWAVRRLPEPGGAEDRGREVGARS